MDHSLRDNPARITKHTLDTPYPVGPVHIYIYESDRGMIMFDTGPPTPAAQKYLAAHIDFDRLEYLFITHSHPDHCGQMKFIQDQSGAKVIMSRYDSFKFEHAPERVESMMDIFRALGWPEEGLVYADGIIKWFQEIMPPVSEHLILEKSATLCKRLGISHLRCPGHSQSDIVYLFEDMAITGDTLLRDIFQAPLLDVDYDIPGKRFCNYSAYCDTIVKLKGMEWRKLLPSHRDYVDNVDERVVYYITKLVERTRTTRPLWDAGKSVYETVITLFGDQDINDPFTMYIKTSETAFIYDFLDNPDLLTDSLKATGLHDPLVEPLGTISL